MKKRVIASILAVMAAGTTCFAAEIPKESAPLNATELKRYTTESRIQRLWTKHM